MNKNKLIILGVGLALLVPIAGLFYRQEAIVSTRELSHQADHCAPGLRIYRYPTADSPSYGICGGDITGNAYGWPSKLFAVATWKYPSDAFKTFEEGGGFDKTARLWKIYPEGIIVNLGLGIIVASPLFVHVFEKRRAKNNAHTRH